MKKLTTLLVFIMLLQSVSATIDFTLLPATQNVQPGDVIWVSVDVNNDEPFWGLSVDLTENPASPLQFDSATPSARLTGGFSDSIPGADSITLYSIFSGSSSGITPGTGQLFSLQYTVPLETLPGTIQIVPENLVVSDAIGGSLPANIIGADIVVQDTGSGGEEEPTTGFYLPLDAYGPVDSTISVPLCLENTDTRHVENFDATFTHDSNIAYVTQVTINQGTGEAVVEEGTTTISISGLHVQNSNCSDESGAIVATITYYLKSLGVTPLVFTSADAEDETSSPFSVQALQNQNGQLGVGVNDVTKSCETVPGIITLGTPVTVNYKLSNPFANPDIGGVDELDTYDSGATGFTRSTITNLLGGSSSLVTSDPAAGSLRSVMTTSSQPLLGGIGTFNIYSVVYNSAGTTTLGSHTFGITAPPPPGLEVSDDQHQDITAQKSDCSVTVITACDEDSDCDDDNVCNGVETCDADNACQPGTPLDCDDGKPNTFDTCNPTTGCQNKKTSGGGGGGGGGGGVSYEEISLCQSCGESNPDMTEQDWSCCGLTYGQIENFCERPETYTNYCSLPQDQEVVPNPFFSTIPEQPERQERTTGATTTLPKTPEPPQVAPQRQAPTPEEDGGSSFLEWIIAILVAALITGGVVYMFKHRRQQPESTVPPVPERPAAPTYVPPFVPKSPPKPPELPPEPKPVVIPKKKEPVKLSADFTELDKYAAAVRARLKKQPKTTKKKSKRKK